MKIDASMSSSPGATQLWSNQHSLFSSCFSFSNYFYVSHFHFATRCWSRHQGSTPAWTASFGYWWGFCSFAKDALAAHWGCSSSPSVVRRPSHWWPCRSNRSSWASSPGSRCSLVQRSPSLSSLDSHRCCLPIDWVIAYLFFRMKCLDLICLLKLFQIF